MDITGADRHDADGKAYIAYFRMDPMMHFIWSGNHEDPVQVTRGESGEAITETFLVPPAALKVAWNEAFAALENIALHGEPDGTTRAAVSARYQAASNAVNHANRQWESSTANVLRQFQLACDEYARTTCDGCDQDPWRKAVHYGTCPLAPKISDALFAEAEAAYDREDQEWFNSQSTEDLTAMWALCCNIHTMPSWDDEVFDALAGRGHFDDTKTV